MDETKDLLRAVCTQIERIATALENVAASQIISPGWEIKGAPLDFDWGAYGAIATDSDELGATVVRWAGHYWQREKLGTDIIYSRSTSNDREFKKAILIIFTPLPVPATT
jgi:hypothetical protein